VYYTKEKITAGKVCVRPFLCVFLYCSSEEAMKRIARGLGMAEALLNLIFSWLPMGEREESTKGERESQREREGGVGCRVFPGSANRRIARHSSCSTARLVTTDAQVEVTNTRWSSTFLVMPPSLWASVTLIDADRQTDWQRGRQAIKRVDICRPATLAYSHTDMQMESRLLTERLRVPHRHRFEKLFRSYRFN